METDVADGAGHARERGRGGGRVAVDHLEGAERAGGCLGGDARASRGAPRRARVPCERGGRSESHAELIELVFHELDPIWSMELIDGVESVAKDNGLSVVLTVSGSRHAPDPDWIEGVMRRRPVGIVLVFSELAPEYRERLRSRAIPFVIVDPAGDPSPDAPSVGSANWSGGLAATRHLIELGHRRIAAITGPEDMMCSLARVDGYRSAMNSAGPADRRDVDPLRRLPRRGRARPRARAARPCPTRRPRSSRAATSRRSACSTRCAKPACAFPTTCRSWATTTSRSPAG